MLDGEPVQVSLNEAGNHLHGGLKGFDKYVWDAYPDPSENSITFIHVSPAGDQWYPGELVIKSKYRLTDAARLLIAMTGITPESTLLNMVHHSNWKNRKRVVSGKRVSVRVNTRVRRHLHQ